MLPSGVQAVYKNRAGWAHDRLKRAGLSTSKRREFWQLTAEGFAFAAAHPPPLTTEQVEKLATGHMDVRLRDTSELTGLGEYLPTQESVAAISGCSQSR